MYPQIRRYIADAPTERERDHANFAYRRPRGNRDVDVDPQTLGVASAAMVID